MDASVNRNKHQRITRSHFPRVVIVRRLDQCLSSIHILGVLDKVDNSGLAIWPWDAHNIRRIDQ